MQSTHREYSAPFTLEVSACTVVDVVRPWRGTVAKSLDIVMREEEKDAGWYAASTLTLTGSPFDLVRISGFPTRAND